MTASTPLARSDFAVTERCAYLNHAAAGVLPKPTHQALRTFVDDHAAGGILGVWPYERRMDEYRSALARFIGAQDGTIAILRNTGDGANALRGGLEWDAGDELLLPDNEFPANVQPWLKIRDRGAAVRFLPMKEQRLTPDVLRAAIGPRTKAVAVSWVSFEDGYRHDLAGLASVAHSAGALFFVDAIQGLGAFPLDVRALDVDALYCGGAKWMLALQGVGFLYVRPELLERLGLGDPGWRSVENMWDFLNYEQPLAGDATRYEGGTPNFIGALSLAESVRVIEAAGTARIGAHVLDLTDRLAAGLAEAGAEVLSLRGAHCSSGIVTFRLPGLDAVELGRRLQQDGIVTTYRPGGVRVAPHGYNLPSEIDALVDTVSRYKKETLCSR